MVTWPNGIAQSFQLSGHMNSRGTTGVFVSFHSRRRKCLLYAECAAESLSFSWTYLLLTGWFLWRQQPTLMSEIPNAPGFMWPAICSQTRPMNWCGRTNTKMSVPLTASATSGTATWDKCNKENEPPRTRWEFSRLAKSYHWGNVLNNQQAVPSSKC